MMLSSLSSHLLTRAVCLRHGCIFSDSGNVLSIRRGKRIIRISPKHFPYVADMAKHFDAYFSQVEPEQRGDYLLADYSTPRVHRLANGLEFELASFPEEMPALESYFQWYTPKQGDVVFDIGAYCGVFSYLLSKAVGQHGRVVSFEPDPLNFEILRRNIERQQLTNVTAINVAVFKVAGQAQFNSEGALGSGLSQTLDRPSAGGCVSVETITFEGACRRYGTPTFAKVDAEGAEVEIIGSAQSFLRQHPINFVLDTNHLRDGKLTVEPVEAMFAECGYETKSSAESGFMTTWARPMLLTNAR
jgi:FkbM family methyltransferase